MERAAYAQMAENEGRHWWFVGRRAVIAAMLDRISLPDRPRILEAGCGTGGNLGLLGERGIVSAFEPFEEAATWAGERNPATEIRFGRLPDDLPYEDGTFDLVAALDVLEHCDDDANSLRALARMTRPGGWILLSVPAHQRLWGSHDRRLHHQRRYGRAQLRELARGAGLEIRYETAFNTVLAPIAMGYRLLSNLTRVDLGNQERMPAGPVNAILGRAFALERQVVARWSIPFGLSYGLILRRPVADAPGTGARPE
jgi:SAM-dependent methyltransferase